MLKRFERGREGGHELTARPTAPNPKTATVEPFFGFATFRVAPRPIQQIYTQKIGSIKLFINRKQYKYSELILIYGSYLWRFHN